MSPAQSGLARVALGAIIALVFHGCGNLQDHITSFIGSVCKTTVDHVVLGSIEQYEQLVIQQCANLKNTSAEHVFNDEKAKQIEKKCLDAAGVEVRTAGDDQMTNYTHQCIDALTNISDLGQITSLVNGWMSANNFSADLDSLLNLTLTDAIDTVTGEIEDDDDEPTEATLAPTEEKETTLKPKEEVETTKEPTEETETTKESTEKTETTKASTEETETTKASTEETETEESEETETTKQSTEVDEKSIHT